MTSAAARRIDLVEQPPRHAEDPARRRGPRQHATREDSVVLAHHHPSDRSVRGRPQQQTRPSGGGCSRGARPPGRSTRSPPPPRAACPPPARKEQAQVRQHLCGHMPAVPARRRRPCETGAAGCPPRTRRRGWCAVRCPPAEPGSPSPMSRPRSRASSPSGIQSPVKTTVSQGTVIDCPVSRRVTSTASTRSRPTMRVTRVRRDGNAQQAAAGDGEGGIRLGALVLGRRQWRWRTGLAQRQHGGTS